MNAARMVGSIAKSFLRALPAALVLALGPALYALYWGAIAAQADAESILRFEAKVKGAVFNGVGEHAAAYLFIHPVPLALAGYATLYAAPWAVVLWATFQPRRRASQAGLAGYLAGVCALLLIPYAIGALASLGLRGVTSPLELAASTLGLYARCTAAVLPYAALSFGIFRLLRLRLVACFLAALSVALLEATGDALSLRLAQRATSYETSAALRHLATSMFWFALLTLVFWGAQRVSRGGLRKLQEVWVMLRQRSLFWVGLLTTMFAAQLSLANEAKAYSRQGHLEITNGAWQVMRAFSATDATATFLRQATDCTSSSSQCGAAVTQAQWNDFQRKVDWARRVLGVQPHSVPVDTNGDGSACFANPNGLDLADFPVSLTDEHHEHNKNVCKVDGRGARDFYAKIVVPADGNRKQGYVLGWHAKNRDDDLKETTIEVPVLATVYVPQILDAGAAGWDKFATAVFTPIACAWKFLSGGSNCRDEAKRWADKTNLPGIINAGIPGVDLPNDELYIGFWHLMDVQSSGDYNDHPGMDLHDGGPDNVPSAVDVAIAAAMAASSTKLDPANSTGDHRYQMSGSDGHQGSQMRSNLDWRKYQVGITEFSPLDNLAWYGYSTFTTDQIKRLGWPLHAIGDATVPMHVVATTGYGHGPYEQWVEDHLHDLLINGFCSTGCSIAWRTTQQQNQAHRVLKRAYRWYSYLQTHNIRDFITALGEQTLSKVTPSGWPWCDLCSAAYHLKAPELIGAIESAVDQWFPTDWALGLLPSNTDSPNQIVQNPLGYYDDKMASARDLIEDAMAGKIAFLTWAASKMPVANQCIPTGHLGCRTTADCCDGAPAYCSTDQHCYYLITPD